MRYQPLPASFHADNRAGLARAIGTGAIAIIDTADEQVRTADSNYPFRPDSNFYYLSGIDQPDAVLVLAPGAADEGDRELLFIRETNEQIAIWEGARYDQAQAAALSGVRQVRWTSELDDALEGLLAAYPVVYTNAAEISENQPLTPSQRRMKSLGSHKPTLDLRSALPQLTKQRLIKAPVEIRQIRRAIKLTGQGFMAIQPLLRPGVREYEIEAELTHVFLGGGAQHAYAPVIAAGASAIVLHYVKNDQQLGNNELILFDIGAEYGWYAADISRTLAIGEPSARQKAVYAAVLRVQQAAIGLIKPKIRWREYEKRVAELVGNELVGLGVLKPAETQGEAGHRRIRRYYPHAASHYLGLDVHDVGARDIAFEPGMIVTCEPGIYLKEEGIGVRLEDDILITKMGNENLSAQIGIGL